MDHTSDDTGGWKDADEAMRSTPSVIHTRGYYVGEDAISVKIAFAKCDDSFSTIFSVAKGTIMQMF